jgi:hypothetical protein
MHILQIFAKAKLKLAFELQMFVKFVRRGERSKSLRVCAVNVGKLHYIVGKEYDLNLCLLFRCVCAMAASVSNYDAKGVSGPVVILLGITFPETDPADADSNPYKPPLALQAFHGQALIDHW